MIPIKSNRLINYLANKTTTGINLIFVIFIRDYKDKETLKHEYTHTRQLIECFIIPYILIYYISYYYNIKVKKNYKILAYINIIFEKEAFDNENKSWINIFIPFNWLRYVKKR